jgi:hypothetical protein
MQIVLLYRNKAEQNKVIQKDIDPLASYHLWEKIAAKRIATAGVQCGTIANNQMGGQAQNLAIDTLLKTLDRIARGFGKHLNHSKKKPLRPTV